MRKRTGWIKGDGQEILYAITIEYLKNKKIDDPQEQIAGRPGITSYLSQFLVNHEDFHKFLYNKYGLIIYYDPDFKEFNLRKDLHR